MIIGDLEADGLWPNVTTIHCAVLKEVETGTVWEFTPDNLNELPSFLDNADALCFHNWFGYDRKVLKKVLNYEYKGKVVDTLLLSRLLSPDMEGVEYTNEKGKLVKTKYPHSVESYGVRFGIQKPKYEDWIKFTPEMLHRCKQDVSIQEKIYDHLVTKIVTLQASDKRIQVWNGLELEQQIAEIIEQQADNGWRFDLHKSFILESELTKIICDIEKKLVPMLPMNVKLPYKNTTCKAFKVDGQLTETTKKWIDKTQDFYPEEVKLHISLVGDFCRILYEPLSISSSQQVKKYLLDNGWKPSQWNVKKDRHNKPLRDAYGNQIKASPMMPKGVEEWDQIAETIDNQNIKLLAEYNKASHRLSQVQGLIRNTRDDYRIEAQANTLATNTRRMAHRVVVNIPKADDKVYYGHRMRELFIASPGNVLVGCDAKALEARIEAHYIYPFDKEGAKELIEGDIHTKNALVWDCTRQLAKNGKYALAYGCSVSKLAKTLGKPADIAQDLYDAFWNANPGLKELKDRVNSAYDRYDYLLSIDNCPLTIRYKHALINTLFQSAGSICMKKANILCDYRIKCAKLRTIQVGNFHDEICMDSHPDDAEKVGLMIVESMREAGRYFKLNIELDGEYMIGNSWAVTH